MKNNKFKSIFPLFLLGLSVFIFLFCRFGLDILKGEIMPVDFEVYYAAFKAILAGNNMYGFPTSPGMEFKYMPFFGIIFSPLALLPFIGAAVTWSLVNGAFFAIGLSTFYFIKFRKIKPVSYIVFFLLALIFVFRSLMPEMKVGNTNLLVLGLFFLFLFFYFRGKIALSALFFTLMACIKLGPLIILLYFIKKRELKFILWFGLFTLLVVLLPPLMLTFSFKETLSIFQNWHKNALMGLPQSIIFFQSLKYLLLRYLTNVDIYKINFLSLSGNVVSVIYKILTSVLILGALFYKGWAKKNVGYLEKEVTLIDISLLFILSIILSHATTYLNYVYLIIPLLILFLIAWGYREFYPKFFWFAFVLIMVLNNFARNSTWKMFGIDNIKGNFPSLVVMVFPIEAIVLYLLLYCLRSRLLAIEPNNLRT